MYPCKQMTVAVRCRRISTSLSLLKLIKSLTHLPHLGIGPRQDIMAQHLFVGRTMPIKVFTQTNRQCITRHQDIVLLLMIPTSQ